jgi:hypothetical protein
MSWRTQVSLFRSKCLRLLWLKYFSVLVGASGASGTSIAEEEEEEEQEEEHSSDEEEEEVVVVESEEENEAVDEPPPANTKRMKLQHDDGAGATSSEMMVEEHGGEMMVEEHGGEMMVEETPAAEPQPAPGGDVADLIMQLELKTQENQELKSEKKDIEDRFGRCKEDALQVAKRLTKVEGLNGVLSAAITKAESSAQQNEALMDEKRKTVALTTENGELKCQKAYSDTTVVRLTEELRLVKEAAAAAAARERTSGGGTMVIHSAPAPPGDLRMKLEMAEGRIYNQDLMIKKVTAERDDYFKEKNAKSLELLQSKNSNPPSNTEFSNMKKEFEENNLKTESLQKDNAEFRKENLELKNVNLVLNTRVNNLMENQRVAQRKLTATPVPATAAAPVPATTAAAPPPVPAAAAAPRPSSASPYTESLMEIVQLAHDQFFPPPPPTPSPAVILPSGGGAGFDTVVEGGPNFFQYYPDPPEAEVIAEMADLESVVFAIRSAGNRYPDGDCISILNHKVEACKREMPMKSTLQIRDHLVEMFKKKTVHKYISMISGLERELLTLKTQGDRKVSDSANARIKALEAEVYMGDGEEKRVDYIKRKYYSLLVLDPLTKEPKTCQITGEVLTKAMKYERKWKQAVAELEALKEKMPSDECVVLLKRVQQKARIFKRKYNYTRQILIKDFYIEDLDDEFLEDDKNVDDSDTDDELRADGPRPAMAIDHDIAVPLGFAVRASED